MKKLLWMQLMCILLLACATFPGSRTDASELMERVEGYNKARISGDHKEAFRYENLRFNEKFSEKLYITNAARSSIEYLDARVISVDINEKKDFAIVKLWLKYKMPPFSGFEKFERTQEITFDDKWVFKEGNWYHLIPGLGKDW